MIKPKNILIIRTDRIGDVILTLPMAAYIKRVYPECKVTFLLREYTKPLAATNPYIDDVITYESIFAGKTFFQKIRALRKLNLDTIIAVHPRPELAFFTFFANVKNRIGSGYRWYSFLYNHKVFEHRKNATAHELEHNIKLLSFLGIDTRADYKNVEYGISATKQSELDIAELFNKYNISTERPIIIVHPGSGGSAVDLPIEKFIDIIKRISDETTAQVIITGSEKEKTLCERLCVSANVKNFAGFVDLKGLIGLISKSNLLLANSTGPIHIAAAVNTYAIGFYPKIRTCAPERWSPYTAKKTIFVPPIKCTNCTREQCEKLQCMNTIKVEDVMKIIKAQITEFQK